MRELLFEMLLDSLRSGSTDPLRIAEDVLEEAGLPRVAFCLAAATMTVHRIRDRYTPSFVLTGQVEPWVEHWSFGVGVETDYLPNGPTANPQAYSTARFRCIEGCLDSVVRCFLGQIFWRDASMAIRWRSDYGALKVKELLAFPITRRRLSSGVPRIIQWFAALGSPEGHLGEMGSEFA